MRPEAVFLLNLLQDVNVARPLALLAALDLGLPVRFLLSDKFVERDTQGTWQEETRSLAADIGAAVEIYDSEYAALRRLADRGGALVASSESDIAPAHSLTHNVFRSAPPSWVRVTLQHGLECVGFLQNRNHIQAHGRHIAFAADIVCGWAPLNRMDSMAPWERSKYVATGPTSLLEHGHRQRPTDTGSGIVCENLHSVRLRGGRSQSSFIELFRDFCARLGDDGRTVALRPHPGGQFVLRQNVSLPVNAVINNLPIYRFDLGAYQYGISAPSSVLVDMVLAGLPTAVWQDEDETVDVGNYGGLPVISSLSDWLAFERDTRVRPEVFEPMRADFLARSGLITDRSEVRASFSRVLTMATQRQVA